MNFRTPWSSNLCYSRRRSAAYCLQPGCANINDSIVLDLAQFTGIKLDLDNGLFYIAAGERWVTVYEKLHPHNLVDTSSYSAKGDIGGLALADTTPSYHVLALLIPKHTPR
ncbi:hypothetical protein HD806DRAFT_315530 [Xylariaceae sp. AK1471]|nr:hypothetical protein HD806DRAFT_315530 [Xylariaceae sp. AK1471]